MTEVEWNALVPELTVSDFAISAHFYTGLLGFSIRHSRQDPPFAYLEHGPVQIMIEQQTDDSWSTGALQKPYGRGVNFQIELPDIGDIYNRLKAAGYALFEDMEENWYATGDMLSGQREFLVQDPDGYLLRFSQYLGEKAKD